MSIQRDDDIYDLSGQLRPPSELIRLLRRARDERDRLELIRYMPTGDNHHNAIGCPYCNPKHLDPEKLEKERDQARDLCKALEADKEILRHNVADLDEDYQRALARVAAAEGKTREVMGQGVSYVPMGGTTIVEAAKQAVALRDRIERHVWLIFNGCAISVGYEVVWPEVVTFYHSQFATPPQPSAPTVELNADPSIRSTLDALDSNRIAIRVHGLVPSLTLNEKSLLKRLEVLIRAKLGAAKEVS